MKNLAEAVMYDAYLEFRRSTPNLSKIGGEFFQPPFDHAAFRTLGYPPFRVQDIEKHLFSIGYHHMEDYHIKDKNILASSYIMRSNDFCKRIFLSEPILDNVSSKTRDIVKKTCDSIGRIIDYPAVLSSPKPWVEYVKHPDYSYVKTESNYIAWVLANGSIPNHFAKLDANLNYCLDFFESRSWRVNTVGGRIKGSKEQLLEQCSTMSDTIIRKFEETNASVPSCFFEFIKRYNGLAGEFDGFLESNASKIFESTDLLGSQKES